MEVTIRDDAPIVRCVKVGDIIPIKEENEDGKGETASYVVTKVYPHHVLAVRGPRRRSICYGDLVIMGLEKQSDILEAMKVSGNILQGARYVYERKAQ